MIRRSNYTKVTLKGLNIERFINTLRDKDVDIYGIHRDNYNKVTMYVSDSDLKVLREYKGNIDIDIIDNYGIKAGIKHIMDRLGLVIGVILSIIMIAILNMYTLHIKVLGLETIDESIILQALTNYGISIGKINNIIYDDLNKYLVSKVDGVSLVSSERKGTALIINIKEKSSMLNETPTNYISPYNMLIRDYEVYAGVNNMDIDKLNKKGDILIYTGEYIDADGVLHLVAPKAKITATIWHTATHIYNKEETIYERTGNKVVNYFYSLGNNKIVSRSIDNPYTYYEIISRSCNVSTTILPIKYNETIYYETTPKLIKNDFDKDREKIIANLSSMVYNEISDNEKVIDEKIDIIELSDKFIVNMYLECDIDIYVGE